MYALQVDTHVELGTQITTGAKQSIVIHSNIKQEVVSLAQHILNTRRPHYEIKEPTFIL